MSNMGLRKPINCLFFVLVSQAIVNCFAIDSECRNFRRSRFNLKLREVQPSNTYKIPDVENVTNKAQLFYWKQNRNQSSYKESDFLWRNPKVLTNIEANAPSKRRSYTASWSGQKFTSTTSTFIESDVDVNQYQASNTSLKKIHAIDRIHKRRMLNKFKTRLPFIMRSPSAPCPFKDPYHVHELVIQPTTSTPNNLLESVLYSHAQAIKKFGISKEENINNNIKIIDAVTNEAFSGHNLATIKVCSGSSQVPTTKSKPTQKLFKDSITPVQPITFTTPGDRVKFFEMYDINTPPNKRINLNTSSEFIIQSKKVRNTKIQEENENFNILLGISNPNTTRVEKLYKNFQKRSFTSYRRLENLNHIQESKLSGLHFLKENRSLLFSKLDTSTRSAVARWSSYPFASVYIYKPTETHCDAAGISPHWLLAAGSCLSRHTLVYSIDERSAFVTYCGEHWRSPERITYVKRSIVHPKFNPKDEVKRLIYNIGLIQVSSSMATSCPLWAPVALMSHQFSTSTAGTMASAVGWGLDRYVSQPNTNENDDEKLPNWPLSVYEALVYHDTCPGSPTLSQAKLQDGFGAYNVYCLSLPPYEGEKNDPVHGGLLLVGGHLVALYLQEERSPWGRQSAQYTGVWRLLPWITDVADEPDDADLTLEV